MQQVAEGTVQRNKRTGEVRVFQGGQWVSQGAPQAAQQAMTIGTPRPPSPKDQIDIAKGQRDLSRPETANLPTGWERPSPTAPARRIEGLPAIITDPKSEGDAKLQVDERTAAFLATRVKGGIQDLDRVLRTNPSAASPQVGAAVAGIFGPVAENYANSPDRQRIEAAQLDILDAALTLGTGAAYTPTQLEGYRRAYFPQLGDAPSTIADKQIRLRRVLEAAKVKAGNAAPMIDEALASLGGDQPLSDKDAQAELRRRIASGADPAETIEWLIATGRPPNKETIADIIANAGNTRPDVRPPEDPHAQALQEGLGGVVEGVGDVMGIVSNPFNATVNAVTGSNLSTDMGQSLREFTGLPEASNDPQRVINALGGGALMGGGFAGAARAAAPYAGGAVQGALTRFGAAPVTDTVASGAGMGSSEVARQQGAGPGGQMLAALAGGGATLPIASRVAARQAPPVTNALTRAGEAEGVTVNRAMADPNVQNRVTGAEATMAGGPIIRRDMGKVGGQIEGRVQELGKGGQALEPPVAGQAVQNVADRYIKNSGAQFKKRYDTVEKAAGGVKVAPAASLQRVDEVLEKLGELAETNKAEIGYLNGLKSDLSKDLSVGALRRLRTTLRKKISKGELTFGENEADVLSIMDSASEDIASGLAAAGKRGVAAEFRRVDADYRDRMQFIGGTLQKIVGKRGANLPPARVFSNLKAMASPKGDSAGLTRLMREMEPEEQADIAATFADALGKNGKGEFSTAFLVSQAQKLPKAAREAAFGPEGAKSLDNLIVLAKEHSRVMGGLNQSRTGVANDYRSWLANLIFGGGAGLLTQSGMTGIAAAAGGLAAKSARDVISARLVMSPKISNWLRTAPRTTSPQAINAHYDRLKAIATREPAIGAEIDQIIQMMSKAANQNVTPGLAAEQGDPANK